MESKSSGDTASEPTDVGGAPSTSEEAAAEEAPSPPPSVRGKEGAVVLTDNEGRVTLWSAAAAELWGCGRDEVLGGRFSSLIEGDPESSSGLGEPGGSPGGCLVRATVRRNDGSEFPAWIVGATWDAHGGGTSYVVWDVSDDRPDGSLMRLLDVLRPGVWEWTPETDRVRLSEGARELLGLGSGEADLASLLGGLHPEDRESVEVAMREVASGAAESLEGIGRAVRAMGGETWIEILGASRTDGGRTRLGGLLIDVTERKRAEDRLIDRLERQQVDLGRRIEERTAELSRANAQLEKAARAKDAFLASMSHELRTPLNTILTLTESLEDGVYGDLDEEQLAPLRIVGESGQHLLELINDILDLSKIGAGKLEVRPRPTDIRDLCESSLSLVRAGAREKGIDLRLEMDEGLTGFETDPKRARQVLVNLLQNAVKFTPENGTVCLEVRADSEMQTLDFSVEDDGIGIDPEKMDRLFQPFSQIDQGLNRSYEGTGLGLALVARLTELLGGSVSAESDGLGQGSRFTVRLPAGRADVGPEPETEAPSPPPDHDGVRVLIVDDNENTLRAFSRALQAKGCHVTAARSGPEALERVEDASPEVVLMDVQMPGMDGLEAIRRIRAGHNRVPVIAVTALAMPGDKERCLGAGADAYLAKPVSLKLLWASVSDLAGSSESRS